MRATVTTALGLAGWFLAYSWHVWAPAQERLDAAHQSPARSAVQSGTKNPKELAAALDALVAQKWREEQVKPAELASDAEFLRRVYLDLVGRIPSVSEARAFLDDPRPSKRADLIRQLLQSAGFVNRWSAIFAEAWLSGAGEAFATGSWRASLQNWIRDHLRRRTGYDRIVLELLSAEPNPNRVSAARSRNAFDPVNPAPPTPTVFYSANGYNPRNLAASVSRQFLGIQLDCAECHNHPFARWKREQFWQLAAFFAGFGRRNAGGQVFYTYEEDPAARSIQIPDTNITVPARFLDGSEPNWDSVEFSRQALARWVTSPSNPYFAKAAVNRVWYQLMGYGLTEPPDDLHEDNPPSHPELLEKLAGAFVASGFDLRFLIEAICLSQTYQLSSRRSDASQDNPRLFARRVVRRMTAAQLWDSLVEAAYWSRWEARGDSAINPFASSATPTRNLLAQRRQEFLAKFRDGSSRPVEAETSVLQVLAFMNGETTATAVRLPSSPVLQMVTSYPWWTDEQRLEVLFLATLSRKPLPQEQERYLRHIEQSPSRESAWTDVLWVLLNSPEFISHH